MEKMSFSFKFQGQITTATVNFGEQDVTIIQTPPGAPTGKADVIIMPLKELIRIADEANEQNVRNG